MHFATRARNVIAPLVWIVLLVGLLAACSTTGVAPEDGDLEVFDITLQGEGPNFYLNAGGKQISAGGKTWQADNDYHSDSDTRNRWVSINGTTMDALYRSFRESNSYAGSFRYDIKLDQNGSYRVKLHFAELYHTASGKRVFDVAVEGDTKLDNLDVYKQVGAKTATVKTFETSVNDGVLSIHFKANRGRPIVNGIELQLLEASGGGGDSGGDSGDGSVGGGSVPLKPVPSNGVRIKPGTDIQKLIDSKPRGTTYILTAGVHRLQSFSPKTGDMIVAEKGAVLSGAKVLDNWTREDGLWVAKNQSQSGEVVSQTVYNGAPLCTDTASNTTVSPRCYYPHDLYVDNKMLSHVTSKSAVKSGKWYFDYGSDKIYMADDPRGRKVETSVVEQAIYGNGSSNVTLRNLVVEKYASPANTPAIDGASSWIVESVEVRYNHAIGIRLGSKSTLRDSYLHHNGQSGVTAQGDGIRVERTEIAYNNELGFNTNWAGGGTKFTKTRNAVIRNNNVHHNAGPGLWFDHENIYMTAENNRVSNNDGPGFLIEVSYDTVLRNNTVENNGYGRTQWVLGAGIFVNMSPNIDIIGNTVRGNYQGVILVQGKRSSDSGKYGKHELRNIEVRDNTITMKRGQTGMVVQGNVSNPNYYFNNNIKFLNNDYVLGGQSKPFKWKDGNATVQQWKAAGHDRSGTFR